MICGLFALTVLGASATSAIASDPMAEECNGLQNGANGFHITTNSTKGGEAADLYGGAVLCGSDFVNGVKKFGFESGVVRVPAGVKIRCANPENQDACKSEPDLKSGQYTGEVNMAIQPLGDLNKAMLNVQTKMYVNQAPAGITGKQNPNKNCTKTDIACYQGIDGLGTGTADTIVKKKNSRYYLYIYKPVPLIPEVSEINYLRIGGTAPGDPRDLHLCKYAGDVKGQQCGSSPDDWMQKNGPSGNYTCDFSLGKKKTFKSSYWIALKPYPKLKPELPLSIIGQFCYPVNWS